MGLERGEGSGEFSAIAGDDDDVGAFGGEEVGDGQAETLGAACDDDGAVGDGEVVLAPEEGHGERNEGES